MEANSFILDLRPYLLIWFLESLNPNVDLKFTILDYTVDSLWWLSKFVADWGLMESYDFAEMGVFELL